MSFFRKWIMATSILLMSTSLVFLALLALDLSKGGCECDWDKYCQDVCSNKYVTQNFTYAFCINDKKEEIECTCFIEDPTHPLYGKYPRGLEDVEANFTMLNQRCEIRNLCMERGKMYWWRQ